MVSRETSCFSDLLICGGREEEFETVQPPTAEEELIEQCEQQLKLHEVNVQTALSTLKKYSVYSSRINEEILMRILDDLNQPIPDFSQNNCIARFYKELKTAAGNYVPFRLQVMFVLLCSGDLSEKIQILADLLDPDCEDQIQKKQQILLQILFQLEKELTRMLLQLSLIKMPCSINDRNMKYFLTMKLLKLLWEKKLKKEEDCILSLMEVPSHKLLLLRVHQAENNSKDRQLIYPSCLVLKVQDISQNKKPEKVNITTTKEPVFDCIISIPQVNSFLFLLNC